MALPYQAVMLIAFGGPASAAEIRPFLARVTEGLAIPAQRLEEVAHHYEAVGGKSPLNEITARQAHALEKLLQEKAMPLPVYVGMRHTTPFFHDTLKQMANERVRRALGFILSSHRSEASWERYQKNIAAARLELNAGAPEIDYCPGWHDHPLFIECWADLVQASLAAIAPAQCQVTPLIFTAHSIPMAMAQRSPYVEQIEATARLIAAKIGHERWSIAYQSRSGRPADPWLEPDVNSVIRDFASGNVADVVVAPIGFVCDHVEVLYDLDIEARQTAASCRIKLHRAACPNDHPAFVRMMADVISRRMSHPDLLEIR